MSETSRGLLMAPGWVRTGLGGPAPLTVGQGIPGVVDTIDAPAGQGGLQYLDYPGQTDRWSCLRSALTTRRTTT